MGKLTDILAYLIETDKDWPQRYKEATGLSPWQNEDSNGSKIKMVKKDERFYSKRNKKI